MKIFPQIKQSPLTSLFGMGGYNVGYVLGRGSPRDINGTYDTSGAYGNAGPTPTQMENSYISRLGSSSRFVYYGSNGILFFKVAISGVYNYTARGACGGSGDGSTRDSSTAGGRPRYLAGTVTLSQDDWMGLSIGQCGGFTRDDYNSSTAGGGGGGTFFFKVNTTSPTMDQTVSQSNTITPYIVAAGGNGSNWDSFNVSTIDARGITSASSDPIASQSNSGNNYGMNIFGRGAFGGSFAYTPYHFQNTSSYGQYTNYDTSTFWRSGAPLLDSNSRIFSNSLKGGMGFNANGQSYSCLLYTSPSPRDRG